MKNLICFILFGCFLLTSCKKDFINLAPESLVTSGNFYKTQAHFNQALVGAYQSLRGAKGSLNSWAMGEFRSDNTHYKYNPGNRGSFTLEAIDLFVDDQNTPVTQSMYNASYSGIARANIILSRLETVDLDQAFENSIIGEAKFIRALLYFDLVRYFGGVPLYLKEVDDVTNAYLPRSSVSVVYNAIESDLKDAIDKLPATTANQNGRATKSSAKMLLADVYLTQKKYTLSEAELLGIINFGVHSLLTDYSTAFNPSNKNSKESIFEIQFRQGTTGQQSDFVYSFLPLSTNLSPIVGFPANLTTSGMFNTPTEDLMSTYEPNDARFNYSIGIAEGTGPVGNMVIESVKDPQGYVKPANKRADPFIRKYLHPHSAVFNTDNNFPIYRYSDVLLTLAEVLNEQNKSTQAIPYLNLVRLRARLLPSNETNQTRLRDIIANERRVEFAFENKRWLDLVRTGKAIDIMNLHGAQIKIIHASEAYLPANSYNVTQNRLIFPIPLREVQVGGLQQNQGY
jgi:hypothetical protein